MDVEEIPEEDTGEHWGRRVGAIIIDFLLVGILTYSIFWAIGMIAFDIFWLLTIWSLVFGIILWIYSGALEGSIGATVGKGIMDLEVVAVDEEMTAGKAFLRNISKIHWILLLIDTGVGFMTMGDPRQKQLDKSAYTVVIRSVPVEVPEQKLPYIAPLPLKEEEDEDHSDWEIPEELLSGNCSLCGTPYKILPPEDNKSWSGLWNSRCIWCNKMVFEDLKRRRKQPGTWTSPQPEYWRSQTRRRWGEPPSSGRAPPPTWRSPGPAWK